MQYVVGGEESYGYLVGDQVRDKDAVQKLLLACGIGARAGPVRESMDRLAAIHRRHGAYKEGLASEGRSRWQAQIAAMIRSFRETPPEDLAGEKVVEILDFQTGEVRSPDGHKLRALTQATSNVIQFVTAEGSRVTVRPSGTEPKIKCYASVKEPWDGEGPHGEVMSGWNVG